MYTMSFHCHTTPHPEAARQLAVTGIGQFRAEPPYRCDRLRGWTVEHLILLTGGRGAATVDGREHKLVAGSLLMTPMDLPHAFWPSAVPGYYEGYWIEYTGPWARDLWRRNGLIGRHHIIDNGSLRHVVEDIVDLFRSRREEAVPEASALLAVLFARTGVCIQGELARTDLAASVVIRARAFMETHMADPIGLAEIAAAVALSKYHFLRVFRERTGFTPLRYLRSLRLARAQELFRTTEFNASEVAYQTGFATLQHFSRVFKSSTGMTPTDFIDAVR